MGFSFFGSEPDLDKFTRDQQMLGADVVVLQALGLALQLTNILRDVREGTDPNGVYRTSVADT